MAPSSSSERGRARATVLACVLGLGLALHGTSAGCSIEGENLFSYRPDGDAGAQGGAGQGGATSSTSDGPASGTQSGPVTSSAQSVGPSSSTGSTCPNGTCDPGETSRSCPQDCPPMCSHGPCETGDALSFGCDPCTDQVCDADPYCCDTAWDDQCITTANAQCNNQCCGDGQCLGESCMTCAQDCGGACVCGDGNCQGETCMSCEADCGACPSGPTCPHTVCFVGEPLNGNDCHDPCVDEVCAQDSTCCDGGGQSWDTSCQQLAAMLCGADPCIVSVCAQMPSCCDDTGGAGGGGGAGGAGGSGQGGGGGPVTTPPAWTQACVDLAKTLCSTACNCPHSVCGQGQELDPGCNPCAAAVCEVDDYCCTGNWDGLCADQAQSVCGIDCM